jgi:hypothetical protein
MRRREYIAGSAARRPDRQRRGRGDGRLLGNPVAARVVNQRGPSTSRRLLTNAGGRDVHVHEFERAWTLKDRPLSDVQFDPFLWWPRETSRNP